MNDDTSRTQKWGSKNESVKQRNSLFVIHLSLSRACQVEVAVSTSSRHADLSNAHRLAVARPKLRGRRSSSTVLSQDCLGLPATPVSGRTQNARLKSSGMVLTGICTTEMSEEWQATSTDSVRQEWLSSARPNLFIWLRQNPSREYDEFAWGTMSSIGSSNMNEQLYNWTFKFFMVLRQQISCKVGRFYFSFFQNWSQNRKIGPHLPWLL